MFSSGYDLGGIPDDVFETEAERLVAHPFTGGARGARRHRPADGRRAARPHDRRRARAGAGLRPARRRRRHPPGDAAGQARPRLLAHRPAPLPRRDRRRRARASCSCSGARSTPRTALGWGLVSEVALPADLDEAALGMAEELAANAPLSVRGNKRVLRELLRAGGALDPDDRARADRAAARLLRLRGPARGRARLRREAPRPLARALTRPRPALSDRRARAGRGGGRPAPRPAG